MRTRVRNQFPRRREIHVDDDVDARARSLVTVTDADARARARRSSSTRTPLASSREDDTEASNGIRRRARAPTREIAARARVLESLLDESRDESRVDRDTRRDRPPIAVGKGTPREHTKGGTRGRVTTGGGGWSFSRPSRRRDGMGDRARGLTSSTRGSWRGREPSIDSIDRDETNGRKRTIHRIDRFDRSIDRSIGRWNGASRACAV